MRLHFLIFAACRACRSSRCPTPARSAAFSRSCRSRAAAAARERRPAGRLHRRVLGPRRQCCRREIEPRAAGAAEARAGDPPHRGAAADTEANGDAAARPEKLTRPDAVPARPTPRAARHAAAAAAGRARRRDRRAGGRRRAGRPRRRPRRRRRRRRRGARRALRLSRRQRHCGARHAAHVLPHPAGRGRAAPARPRCCPPTTGRASRSWRACWPAAGAAWSAPAAQSRRRSRPATPCRSTRSGSSSPRSSCWTRRACELLFHAFASGVLPGRRGVVFETKSGPIVVRARSDRRLHGRRRRRGRGGRALRDRPRPTGWCSR